MQCQTQESYHSLEEGGLNTEGRGTSPSVSRLSPPLSPALHRTLWTLRSPSWSGTSPWGFHQPPTGFEVYDCTIANHTSYEEKIHLPDKRWVWPHYICCDHDFEEHKQYVMGQHDETGHATRTVRWPLQANLFVGPAPHFSDNHDLFVTDATSSLIYFVARDHE